MIHRSNAVYILNDKRQLLLLFHKKLNVWIPPGGHIEEGELTHESARREVYEETGLGIQFLNLHPLHGILDERACVLPQPLLIQSENQGDHIHEDFVYVARATSYEMTDAENHIKRWHSFSECYRLHTFENIKKHIQFIEDSLQHLGY